MTTLTTPALSPTVRTRNKPRKPGYDGDSDAYRLAVLAAISQSKSPPNRRELTRSCRGWASEATVYRQLDLLWHAGLIERKAVLAESGKGREYRFTITAQGRAIVPSGASPASIFAARSAAELEAVRAAQVARIRAAVLSLIDEGTYPSAEAISERSGHGSNLCFAVRDELEDTGELPSREDWPEHQGPSRCLPCTEYRDRKRVWRRAAIIQASVMGWRRPSGRTWKYTLEPEPEPGIEAEGQP